MKFISDNDSKDLNTFRRMIISEWGRVDSFDTENKGVKVPGPILAKEGEEVIGGVAFTWYKKPNKKDVGLWVNALYVVPSQRNKGVGSKLLGLAMKNIDLGYGLFALTEKPELYIQCGWSVLSQESSSYILKYESRISIER